MEFINLECDYCGKKDKPVFERYKITDGMEVKMKWSKLHNQYISDTITYSCADCYKKSQKDK